MSLTSLSVNIELLSVHVLNIPLSEQGLWSVILNIPLGEHELWSVVLNITLSVNMDLNFDCNSSVTWWLRPSVLNEDQQAVDATNSG